MENPIKDNRIVDDKTFALRLKNFILNVEACDQPSQEEKDYLLMVAYNLLTYQVETAVDSNELAYLVMNKVIK